MNSVSYWIFPLFILLFDNGVRLFGIKADWRCFSSWPLKGHNITRPPCVIFFQCSKNRLLPLALNSFALIDYCKTNLCMIGLHGPIRDPERIVQKPSIQTDRGTRGRR
ncbi:hypothetical protein I7I50_09171 [Histoplasma capsulatum G186AR]|uniref:Uncharacterized protein n=1 Tax=Ajellomyces capsulatus TaxID=5037 RepID=A0A8H7YTU4_AJECA|nr:hypothetical protein I7I52_06692 [Histoplasma capsulatum]QSS74119.1 hypothetical protein I7I50_09171 [Histoplasma capsulatum G186AR]